MQNLLYHIFYPPPQKIQKKYNFLYFFMQNIQSTKKDILQTLKPEKYPFIIKNKQDDKPGSVLSDHLSRTAVANSFKRPT